MKNRGFTLVEMLAVIIVLALLGLVGIISVESIVKRGTEKAYQAQMSEIKTAAENLVKIDGEPTWCEGETVCFVSLRYLAFKKQLKLNDDGEYINPKTDKPFSLETVSMVKKYGENYVFSSYESIDALEEETPGYLNKARKHAVAASAVIYKESGYCEGTCNIRVSDLVSKNLLESDFYNDVVIRINEANQVEIG